MSVFSNVPTSQQSQHRNHLTPENKMSFNFGYIYPIFCKTVLPHDRWSMNLQSFVRTVPLLSPVMHRNDIKVDAFFVPMRLIWTSAEKWHQCIDDTIKRPMLYVGDGTGDSNKGMYNYIFGESTLSDYLGFASIPYDKLTEYNIPLSHRKVCALPFRAYRMIYDYYFRNKALEDDILTLHPDFYGDSDNVYNSGDHGLPQLCYRGYRRDQFTSALPDPQNGSDILIPGSSGDLGDLEIVADTRNKPNGYNSQYMKFVDAQSGQPISSGDITTVGSEQDGGASIMGGSSSPKLFAYDSGLRIVSDNDSNDSEGATIRQLRTATMLEEYEEAAARGGGNKDFKSWLRSIWNVKSSDARLDRPEYLGGYRGPIQISEVPQTSQGTESSAQGTLAGKGLSLGGSRLFSRCFFEEPGILMVTMSVVPKSAYCQGDPREWLYDSPFDFPNPFFDRLGEQPVFKQEINALAGLLEDEDPTFGYNVRNYEMKSFPDEVHGALRSSLAYWHEGRIFDWDSVPNLNWEFTKVEPNDVSRIFPSIETSDKLIGQFFFDIRLKRKLNWYGVPKYGM